jgi:hypothetical protein
MNTERNMRLRALLSNGFNNEHPFYLPSPRFGAPYRQPGLSIDSFSGCRCQMPLDVASGYDFKAFS